MSDFDTRERPPYTLFRRPHSRNWQMRFSIPGFPQTRLSLGTADYEEAQRLADRKYQEAEIKAENGLLAGFGSFRAVAKDYVNTLYKQAEERPNRLQNARYSERVVDRYLVPFFGTKAVTAIHYKQLADYTDWRRSYWTTGPGKNKRYSPYQRGGETVEQIAKHEEATDATLKRESHIIRGVFKHAVRKGLIKPGDIPQQEIPKAKTKRRPAFTKEQYLKLLLISEQRIAEAVERPGIMFERGMLHGFISVAAETGLRPKEMFNLNWGHIEGLESDAQIRLGENASIIISAYGKGKEPQRMVPKNDVVSALLTLRKVFAFRFGREPRDDEPVFCNKDRKRITTFNNSLNALLKAAGLKTDAHGRKFSSYCFRHSYATWARQQSPPVDVYTLATNMRTSVAMIEKYYSDAIPEDQAAFLR